MMDEQKEDSDSKFSFKPPLFQQRYTKVADIIRNSDVKKVNIFFFDLLISQEIFLRAILVLTSSIPEQT